MLEKAKMVMIKSSPLLDISAGLQELKNVTEIHIVSVKNECKELLWIIGQQPVKETKIICATLNETVKTFSFYRNEAITVPSFSDLVPDAYLFEPDAALLKSGAFDLIGNRFGLRKLHPQSHLYEGQLNYEFPGRIFTINQVLTARELKSMKGLSANIIVRNYPEKAEEIAKKYNIKPSQDRFMLFTELKGKGYVIFDTTILKYY